MFIDEITDINAIILARYTSFNPKKIYLVKTDLFSNSIIEEFDVVKVENNLIYGWIWRNNIRNYIQIPSDFNLIDMEIKPFKTKKGAKNYLMWLMIKGNKNEFGSFY